MTPFSVHCISDHRISNQMMRTFMFRFGVKHPLVRNTVGRKVGNLQYGTTKPHEEEELNIIHIATQIPILVSAKFL